MREVTLQSVPVALRIEEMRKFLFQDEELEAVCEALETGQWSKAPKDFELVSHELT